VAVPSEARGVDLLVCRIPSHRNDLQLAEDLVEEVARVHGYEHIPSTLPVAQLQPVSLPRDFERAERARDALAALGLTETVNFPFVRPQDLAALAGDPAGAPPAALRLLNPIQDEESVLRTSLLPSLLRVVRQNLSRQVDRVGVFELARCYRPRGDSAESLPEEPLAVAVALTAGRDAHLWAPPEPPPLFFQAKGIAERLLSALGYVACYRRGGGAAFLHPGAEAEFSVEDRVVGSVGELHPAVARHFDIDVACAVIQIDLDALPAASAATQPFREVSREPSIRRDVAITLDRDRAAGEILESIGAVAGSDLVSVEIFDRYEGKGVPEGRVSLAFRMIFQRADRTLTDAEVTKATNRVVRTLKERFGAQLR